MPSPIGTWNIQGDFLHLTLIIAAFDEQGNFSNVTLDLENILGFWDEGSQKITFLRTNPSSNDKTATPEYLSRMMIFTGYLLSDETGSLAFAGTYHAFQGSGATSQRSLFGWYGFLQ